MRFIVHRQRYRATRGSSLARRCITAARRLLVESICSMPPSKTDKLRAIRIRKAEKRETQSRCFQKGNSSKSLRCVSICLSSGVCKQECAFCAFLLVYTGFFMRVCVDLGSDESPPALVFAAWEENLGVCCGCAGLTDSVCVCVCTCTTSSLHLSVLIG